jgi:hypothetical protein
MRHGRAWRSNSKRTSLEAHTKNAVDETEDIQGVSHA